MANPTRMPMRLVLVGVLCLVGGESFCLFGPHVEAVHLSCHVVLYAGIGLVVLGAVVHFAGSK